MRTDATQDDLDPASAWIRQRERFHRARAARIVLPAVPPILFALFALAGALPLPDDGWQTVVFVVTLMTYGAFWVYLIRDARRFVDFATQLDERYRGLIASSMLSREVMGTEAPRFGPVIALAGRRVDAHDAEAERLPLANVGDVKDRLRELFESRDAAALVCSAACGADLLALDAAGSLGMRRRVVLPFEPSRFRPASVTDRPGSWGPLFDKVLRGLAPEDLILLGLDPADPEAFAEANRAILDAALDLAGAITREGGSTRRRDVLAVVVWEGAPRGPDDLTAAFAEEARGRDIPVEQVSTAAATKR